jgi:hypothetical protein
MEPEGSLPCSQKPSTGSYPESNQSSHTTPSYLRSILILSTSLRLVLPSDLFPPGLSLELYLHSSSPPFVLHAFPLLHHFNYTRTCRAIQVMILLFTRFLQPPFTSPLLRQNVFFNTLFLKSVCLFSSLNVRDQISIQNHEKNDNFVNFYFYFLDSRREDGRFWIEW